ncbi:MAG TPA: diguanylate cyclase [Candidatus Limnocylindrales bacterium]|nr:diguanylate cyclase [Candidatus Limnocylindrales bacterium]
MPGGIGAPRGQPAPDRPLRLSWRLFASSFVALAVLMVLRLTTDRARPLDWLLAALVLATGLVAVRHQALVRELEAGRRTEAEAFARILRGLSRSVSPDAIVTAIVDELADVTGADHVVVVRRRSHPSALEATLVSTRPGVPSSTTLLPATALEDAVGGRQVEAPTALAVIEPVAVAAAGRPGPRPLATVTAPPRPGAGVEGGGHPPSGAPVRAIAASAARAYGLANTIAEPLLVDGRIAGALILSRRTRDAWPEPARRMLAAAATEASAALARADSYREAAAAASTDGLTGLPNRRYFDEFCGLLARRRRADDAVGVLMIDVDRFKVLNDRYGHPAGDRVLHAIAGAIAASIREADVPARYGGEEFAVLLRNPGSGVALEVAERVRSAVRGLDLGELGLPAVSVSVGVAVAQAPDEPIADLVGRADRALYRAKRAGRDRVVAG